MEIKATFTEKEMQMDGNFGEVMIVGNQNPFEGGAIQVCCAVQAMLTSKTGDTGTTSLSSVKAGTPVVGQYAIYSNGLGKVLEITETNFTVEVVAYHYIRINNGVSTTKSIFAPTTGGVEGQVLVSQGSGKAPVWKNLSEIK